MIYKADASVINFLLTARLSSNQEELHESSKTVGHYILIDYFDWLDYINKIDNEDLIDRTLYEFRTIYSECKEIIKILQSKIISDNISNILQINKKVKCGNISKTRIEFLCQGYQHFVEEIHSLQIYLLNSFKYNNFTLPILLVPFSFGLNRLSTGHVNICEQEGEDGLLETVYEKGFIRDNCQRSPIDFGIRTYTFYKTCEQKPYSLPLDWQISKSFCEKDSQLIKDKTRYISDCYSQYCYSGIVDDTTKNLFTEEAAQVEGSIQGNKLYTDIFLLNFPFLLKNMALSPHIVNDVNVNQVDFEKAL